MSESVNDRYESLAKDLGVSVEFFDYVDHILQTEAGNALRRFLSLPIAKTQLVFCCASLRRLKSILEAICVGPWVSVRGDGDEFLYQSIYGPLMTNLEAEGFESALAIARDVLPDALPDGESALDEWEYGIRAGLGRLEAVLMKRCIAEAVNPYYDGTGADVFFVSQDAAIANLQNESKRLNRHFYDTRLKPATPTAARTESAGRGGRPKVNIPADRIAEVFWQMRDELHDAGEKRDPTQKEVCDRLTELGHRVSEKPMRRILHDAGILEWPPPRPLENAA